jgi:hypothetical protein
MGRFVFVCALVAAIAPAVHSQSYRTEYKLSTVLLVTFVPEIALWSPRVLGYV